FKIQTRSLNNYSDAAFKGEQFVNCSKNFVSVKNDVLLRIPKGTLYNSTPIVVENDILKTSRIVIFPEVNLSSAATIAFPTPAALTENTNKIVLKSGTTVYTGTPKNDSVFFDIKNFGIF